MPSKSEVSSEVGPHSFPVAIYARVSTEKQVGGRFDSTHNQIGICRDYIHKRAAEGWYEAAVFNDEAQSGGSMNRPGMRELQRRISNGEFRAVLMFKLERLSRNIDEIGPFRALLEKHQCELVSATEDISELEPEGRLKNNILISVSDFERRNTAKKTRIKMREQAKRGYWNGGLVPFGYTYDKNSQTLQIHPDESRVVRRIFEEASRLVPLQDIANALNAEGHRTKNRTVNRRDGTEQKVGGRIFRSDGLRLILRNPIYRGSVKFEGIQYRGQHAALVAIELWDKANAATSEIIPRPIRAFQERDVHNHLLKGIANCGSCGRALVPCDSGKKSKRGTKYRYYTCGSVLRERQESTCSVGRLSADALEKVVLGIIGEVSKHPVVIGEILQVSAKARTADSKTIRAELDQIKQSLAEIGKKLDNCAEAVARGGIEALEEALKRRATELQLERNRLLFDQEKRRQNLAASEIVVLEEKRIRANLDRVQEVVKELSPAEQKELIRSIVEEVKVRPLAAVTSSQAGVVAPAQGRTFEVLTKLRLPELVQMMEARQKNGSFIKSTPDGSLGSVDLNARVDFTHAQRGEVSIVAPFRQTIRISERVRQLRPQRLETEHPILRARKWHDLLSTGQVGSQLELAKRFGVNAAVVTRVLKLLDLAPDIQTKLASMKLANEVLFFGYKPMGKLAALKFADQRRAFGSMQDEFADQQIRNTQRRGLASIAPALGAKSATPKLGVA